MPGIHLKPYSEELHLHRCEQLRNGNARKSPRALRQVQSLCESARPPHSHRFVQFPEGEVHPPQVEKEVWVRLDPERCFKALDRLFAFPLRAAIGLGSGAPLGESRPHKP